MRALSVVTISLPFHTGDMAVVANATTFVTGASGFIGTELINVPRSSGDSSKSSRRSMSNHDGRLTAAAATGEHFEDVVLPHLDAAHRLARWLTGNEHDAEDVVQEASLRAFRYFRTFTGGSGRAWFLRIVRNTSCHWHSRGFRAFVETFDEEQHSNTRPAFDPEALLLRTDDVTLVERAMSNLPSRFRELLVLRELEGLSYREVADAIGIPIGTVMSGLSRARQALRGALGNELKRCPGME